MSIKNHNFNMNFTTQLIGGQYEKQGWQKYYKQYYESISYVLLFSICISIYMVKFIVSLKM